MHSDQSSKVLIVDDIKSNCFSLEYILTSLNIEIIYANSGEEALNKLLNHQFAVILMSVELPAMSAYEAVQFIHGNKSFKHIPIVMLTKNEHNNMLLNKAYEAGAVDYVTTPIEPVVIINKVRQFVELDKLHRIARQEKKNAEEANSRLQVLLNSAGEGVLGIDLEGKITFANPKSCELLDIDYKALISSNLQDFFVFEVNEVLADTDEKNNDVSWKTSKIITSENSFNLSSNERWKTAKGEKFYVEYTSDEAVNSQGHVIGGVVVFQNITQRKKTEQKLHYLANYDSLTDLSNRAYFYDSLNKAILRTKRSNLTLAVLFIDLDHFKFVNDQYGHDAGDALLQYVSIMLRTSVREGDLVARLGGDEFAIILYDIDNSMGVVKVAEKILSKVSEPVDIEGIKLNVSVSIGIAHYEEDTMDIDDLLKAADTAMYGAKTNGRNNFQFFATNMQEMIQEKQRIQIMLQDAIKKNELSVVYQPRVSVKDQKIVGVEALLRWLPEQGGAISPNKFIPIAEESGQIEQLGAWIFEQVCQQIQKWNKLPNFEGISVSVNASVCQLRTDKFMNFVKSKLKKYNVKPSQIEIEITETAMSDNIDVLISELQKINKLGICISMDDFGTGHASLDYLRKLPLDRLKIDRSFIQDIGNDDCDEEIIKVVIAIAKKMSLDLVAEGVETKEQLAFLFNEECDVIQGFYFSKPVTAESFVKYLETPETLFLSEFNRFEQHLTSIKPAKIKMKVV